MLIDELTTKQMNVVNKVADGLTNKQVAIELGLSERTVHCHLTRLYHKLNIISRYKLISMVLTERLTKPENKVNDKSDIKPINLFRL